MIVSAGTRRDVKAEMSWEDWNWHKSCGWNKMWFVRQRVRPWPEVASSTLARLSPSLTPSKLSFPPPLPLAHSFLPLIPPSIPRFHCDGGTGGALPAPLASRPRPRLRETDRGRDAGSEDALRRGRKLEWRRSNNSCPSTTFRSSWVGARLGGSRWKEVWSTASRSSSPK